jgi:molybdopterin molybdotransferase
LIPDSFSPKTVDAALSVLSARIIPIEQTETLNLTEVGGRVLARAVVSPRNIPESPLSAMDGYAFHSRQLSAGGTAGAISLEITGRSLAGHALQGAANPAAAIRIFTGAVVPNIYDTVIPQELTAADELANTVSFSADVIKAGANVRGLGEDLAAGAVALMAGTRIGPREIALLASLGIASLPVIRQLRIAVLSTGDEVQDPGRPLPEGKIFDANRPMLLALIRASGAQAIDLGIVKDDPDSLRQAIHHAADISDAVITSGGVSVGEADYTRRIMQSLGDIDFWKLAIKPGRPLAAGHISPAGPDRRQVPFFGLPGNPVAAFVTFNSVVAPCLDLLAGVALTQRPMLRARLAVAAKKIQGRTEYLRCALSRDAQGDWIATIAKSQGAASLKSLTDADGLAVLPHDAGPLAAGTMVDVIPLITT